MFLTYKKKLKIVFMFIENDFLKTSFTAIPLRFACLIRTLCENPFYRETSFVVLNKKKITKLSLIITYFFNFRFSRNTELDCIFLRYGQAFNIYIRFSFLI